MSAPNERAPGLPQPGDSKPDNVKSTSQEGQGPASLLEHEAVCSTDFLADYIPRAAAVIHQLRRSGYGIVTRPCSRGHAHATRQIEYVLEWLPEPIGVSHG